MYIDGGISKGDFRMEPVLYLLMRNDLPSLNPGKLAAQAAHVANAFAGDVAEQINQADEWLHKLYAHWHTQTLQHCGTTIVLAVGEEFLLHLKGLRTKETQIFSGIFHDPSYPMPINWELAKVLSKFPEVSNNLVMDASTGRATFLRDEMTGAYVFADKNNDNLKILLSNLDLYP